MPECKHTPADRIITVELPRQVSLPLKQHIGLPAIPVVKRGDTVVRGQMIARAAGQVSAPVHASISGTVTNICPVQNTAGYNVESIVIKASEEDHTRDEAERNAERNHADWHEMQPKEIISRIAEAGIVGLGGATFPTAVKVDVPKDAKVDTLIINAAECEPYLTCDDALMRLHPAEITEGIRILIKASGVDKAVVGIEDNKPEAIAAMSDAAAGDDNITVQQLKTKYPQGGEKQLINAITGKEVPSGNIPASVGVIVLNVATAFAVYKAVVQSVPLIEKVITIAGYGNYRVALGMLLSDMPIDTSASMVAEADVIIGGPMMGKSTPSLSAPIEKGTSGVTVVPPLSFNPEPCIRCGECVRACPMGLQPYLISTLSRLGKTVEAVAEGARDCIECGSCNYSCPSGRPIIDYIRLAKKSEKR